ncbi:MAG: NAD(P)-dependent oxidoreductase, partial [Stackebrandtia sp.]
RMGSAMTRRLRETGTPVTVWNRNTERCETARRSGAGVAADPSSAVADADVVLVMVSDGRAVAEVLREAGPAVPESAVVVQMSTIAPDETRALADNHPELALVEAPVAGSVPQVLAGSLKVLAAGDGDRLECARPVLDKLGAVQHCGELGDGSAAKLVVNGSMIAVGVLLAASVSLARDLGFDVESAKQVLAGTVLGPVLERYDPGGGDFPIYLAAKDVRLAAAAAADPAVFEAAAAHLEGIAATDPQAGLWTVVAKALS